MLSIPDIRAVIADTSPRFGVRRVSLFGSYARGNASERSDVDLHIEKGELRGLFALCRYKAALEQALAVPVDLVETDGLAAEVLRSIEREGILLYERA